jgi:hypothetical protein
MIARISDIMLSASIAGSYSDVNDYKRPATGVSLTHLTPVNVRSPGYQYSPVSALGTTSRL